MNYKISVVLILIALVASVLLSGCIEAPFETNHEDLRVVQIDNISDSRGSGYSVYFIDNNKTSKKVFYQNQENDYIVNSNKTIIRKFYTYTPTYALLINKSETINDYYN